MDDDPIVRLLADPPDLPVRDGLADVVAALNMLGSVAFGISAVAARYVPSTGESANLALVNLGTFLGAVCFLVGAVLLPVESARERSSA